MNEADFNRFWSYTSGIIGTFDEGEAKEMFNIIKGIGERGLVVEIGSYYGRSSSLIGQVAYVNGFEFVCIDNFVMTDKGKSSRDQREEFYRNMDREGIRYWLVPLWSRRAVKLFKDEEIDFLFIDGDHEYKSVKEDHDLYVPKVKKGGYIFFHDYRGEEGVKKVVDESKMVRLEKVVDYTGITVKL